MSAPTQLPPRPASPQGRADTRLPWWALALPTLAFVTLLLLILDPAQAHAAGTGPGTGLLFEHIRQLMAR
ncbi:hypothetical protein SZN_14391 [Streptomyces zinciresistens K42]|uniref:Uncharacterized protein n=1 Tax=Streptomyces zinciresistens K42 TaxID=700597 RepID=G2GBK4_9ACTN|nr:hypothetical protein [Streptomyces zinciresistens]EGX59120.1 hypothetical protein SZN_14391 [Streptomyces zinciresistens K42]